MGGSQGLLIAFGAFLFLYLFIGWVVAYEAHKRDWNSRLDRYDRAGHMGWWLMWWWRGGIILSQTYGGWSARFGAWSQGSLEALFERMMNIEWRKHGTKDERSEGG